MSSWPSNNAGITDEDGAFSDWVEVTNGGTSTVDLAGYRLTDDATSPAKWVFPSISIVPGQQVVVWASSKNRFVPPNRAHTNFALGAGGEYLGLRDRRHTLERVYRPIRAQTANVSYGVDVNGNIRSFSTRHRAP